MKTIVITGLDGSGKSTVFRCLEEQATQNQAFLHLPFFKIDQLPSTFPYQKLCIALNEMGTLADKDQKPLLKIFSLFGSMMLFSKLEELARKEHKSVLFCERHPLIDAPIYAIAYHRFLQETYWNEADFHEMDHLYPIVWSTLIPLLPISKELNVSPSFSIFQLIAALLGTKTPDIVQLKSVFKCQSPARIYFLDAPVETLLARLATRKVKEQHEEKEPLENMRKAYLGQLHQTKNTHIVPFETMDQLHQLLVELSARDADSLLEE